MKYLLSHWSKQTKSLMTVNKHWNNLTAMKSLSEWSEPYQRSVKRGNAYWRIIHTLTPLCTKPTDDWRIFDIVWASAPVLYLRKIIPILDTVAGEAQLKSWVSNTKLTFGPNWILSPLGMVRSRLSSRTEFRDSIHSGSISPSHIIHELTSVFKTAKWR